MDKRRAKKIAYELVYWQIEGWLNEDWPEDLNVLGEQDRDRIVNGMNEIAQMCFDRSELADEDLF